MVILDILMQRGAKMNIYESFIKIIELGSFTKAAESLGYTQSAISQMIHNLEKELDTTLIIRSRKGITLTPDGEQLLPYIKNICNAHYELREKHKEMQGLESGFIRIGTFSSVSTNWIPTLIHDFKQLYPGVHFELQQGEYTSISKWVAEGSVDFGFVNPIVSGDLTTIPLAQDELLAVLPYGHELADHDEVHLKDLIVDPFIQIDEGDYSEPQHFFEKAALTPNTQFKVYDDYTIMAMVEQGLGISILPKLVLSRCSYHILTKKITPPVIRTISIAYKNKKVLPIASRYFIDFITDRYALNKKAET